MSSWCHRDARATRDCQLPPLPASGLPLLLCCAHSAIAAGGRWGASAAQRLPSFSELLPKPFSTMDCDDLLSTAGRDQILRRDIHGSGSSPLPGDCHRQTYQGQEWTLKGADPLRACLLQGGPSHLSDLLHIKSVTSSCPHGLHLHPIPITGVAATSCLNMAGGAGCSRGKGSACLKSPFFAERCPQPPGAATFSSLVSRIPEPSQLWALGSCTHLARRSPCSISLSFCFLKMFVINPSSSP